MDEDITIKNEIIIQNYYNEIKNLKFQLESNEKEFKLNFQKINDELKEFDEIINKINEKLVENKKKQIYIDGDWKSRFHILLEISNIKSAKEIEKIKEDYKFQIDSKIIEERESNLKKLRELKENLNEKNKKLQNILIKARENLLENKDREYLSKQEEKLRTLKREFLELNLIIEIQNQSELQNKTDLQEIETFLEKVLPFKINDNDVLKNLTANIQINYYKQKLKECKIYNEIIQVLCQILPDSFKGNPQPQNLREKDKNLQKIIDTLKNEIKNKYIKYYSEDKRNFQIHIDELQTNIFDYNQNKHLIEISNLLDYIEPLSQKRSKINIKLQQIESILNERSFLQEYVPINTINVIKNDLNKINETNKEIKEKVNELRNELEKGKKIKIEIFKSNFNIYSDIFNLIQLYNQSEVDIEQIKNKINSLFSNFSFDDEEIFIIEKLFLKKKIIKENKTFVKTEIIAKKEKIEEEISKLTEEINLIKTNLDLDTKIGPLYSGCFSQVQEKISEIIIIEESQNKRIKECYESKSDKEIQKLANTKNNLKTTIKNLRKSYINYSNSTKNLKLEINELEILKENRKTNLQIIEEKFQEFEKYCKEKMEHYNKLINDYMNQ